MPQTSDATREETREQSRPAYVTGPAQPHTQRDVLNHANFGLLPVEKGRSASFYVSAGINLAIVALVLVLTATQVHEAHVKRQEMLVYVAPPPKPYVPPVPKIRMPPPPILKVEPNIPQPPKPVIEPPKPEPMKVAAKAPAMPAPAPRPVVTPPRPVLGAFKSAQAPAAVAPKVAAAQAAGFGAPTGAHATDANKPSQLATVGAFGAANNANQGAAAHRGAVASTGFGSGAASGSPNGSARGVVASTGFGSGSQPAGMPGGRGTVASTGFGAGSAPGGSPGGHGTVASTGFGAGAPPAGERAPRVQEPVTTSIVVLAKPLPQYTAEAREARIQGDVTLEVRFTADGRVDILRVINGLGHGLDEQARLAASRIRFKPATRDGKPVDQVSVIHIVFQLA